MLYIGYIAFLFALFANFSSKTYTKPPAGADSVATLKSSSRSRSPSGAVRPKKA